MTFHRSVGDGWELAAGILCALFVVVVGGVEAAPVSIREV